MENFYNSKLLNADLTYRLNGIAIQVRKEIGRYAREKQYCDLFEAKLKERGIVYRREQIVGDTGNRPDFIIEEKVLLEMKAKTFVIKEDYFQVQRYLHILNLELGIIYNFREEFIKPHRILRVQ
jgi:GxxExxY protein